MAFQSVFSAGSRFEAIRRNALLTFAMGSAVVLLGCGGGGGGGGGNPGGGGGGTRACGSAEGSNQSVVCGYVVSNTTGQGVNGVQVFLTDAAGNAIGGTQVTTSTEAGSAGFYRITVPAGAVRLGVNASAAGYLTSYLRIGNNIFDGQPTGGTVCFPQIAFNRPGDKRLATPLQVYSSEAAPPPPVFNCPSNTSF
jgi:hypothetical protein